MRWWQNQGLRLKVALGITLTMVIILGIVFIVLSQYFKEQLWQSEIQKTEDINAIAGIFLDDAMMTGRRDTVQDALSELGQNVGHRQLVSIAVYNPQNELTYFASGFNSEVIVPPESMPENIEDPSCWNCHQYSPGERPTHLVVTVGGTDVIRNSVPLYNEERCQTCHGTDKQLLGDVIVDYSLDQFNQSYSNVILGLVVGAFLAIVIVGVVLYQAMSRIVLNPMREIIEMADEISQGNLKEKLSIRGSDEIGFLARSFNSMASQLGDLIESLEQRVAERTLMLTKRAFQIQTAADVGKAAARLRNPDQLLKQVTQMISQRFQFYHVGVFLIDDSGEYAILRSANSEGGERMLARKHKLKVGEAGIVGYVTKAGEPRIALDVRQDINFTANPDLPDTRSEMCLPLIAGEKTIGALDIQSTQEAAFSEDDITTLRVLADQIAIAIENARLFAENQAAIEATRQAYGEISRAGWQRLLQEKQEVGYFSTEEGAIKRISGEPDPEYYEAILSLQPILSKDRATLYMPISLRGQALGVLRLCQSKNKQTWKDDDIQVVGTLAEQLSSALESSRLFDETTSRAEREQMVTEITTKIRSTTDPQVMLVTAVEELQRILGIDDILIKPYTIPQQPNTGSDPDSTAKRPHTKMMP